MFRSAVIKIRNNNLFEIIVAVIIVISALNIGLSTYENISTSTLEIIKYLDYVITIFFLIEIIIRMTADESLFKFFKSGWNIFDLIVLTVSLIPAESLDSALIFRVVMFVNFYMFAALGSIFFAEIDPLHWGNIGLSMLTLFQTVTLEGWPDLMYDAFDYNPYSWIFFVVFIILNSLIFMNMIVGVIIDIIVKENNPELPDNIKLLNEINSKLDNIFLKKE